MVRLFHLQPASIRINFFYLLKGMEGNRVQKSKHANVLIQSCNHVNVTVSTMYVCNTGDASYISRKCISQYCSLHNYILNISLYENVSLFSHVYAITPTIIPFVDLALAYLYFTRLHLTRYKSTSVELTCLSNYDMTIYGKKTETHDHCREPKQSMWAGWCNSSPGHLFRHVPF
jgi:hypothetical protein